MPTPEVIIYTGPECGISEQVEELLDQKGIPYKVVDLTGKPELIEKLCQKVGGQQRAPMISVGDEMIAGFEPHELQRLLEERFGK